MIMEDTSKKWIDYAVLWSLIASPCLILAYDSPEDSIVTLLLLIVIFLYITYKYGKENHCWNPNVCHYHTLKYSRCVFNVYNIAGTGLA